MADCPVNQVEANMKGIVLNLMKEYNALVPYALAKEGYRRELDNSRFLDLNEDLYVLGGS